MTRFAYAAALVVLASVATGRSGAATGPPAWAYPPVTARTARACGACHLPNGFGRPDSASLAGLPATYIEQQIADYRRGVRKSAEPAMGASAAMAAIALSASDADVRTATEHFASTAYTPWLRVVEVAKVPATKNAGGLVVPVEDGGTEPIGSRIVEMAVGPEAGGSLTGFVAYVPIGSLKRGETLVTTGGGGRTVRCALCHGDDLRGLGPVPGIAGRSPSYEVRQLYDMQQGFRHGLGADLMKATVARLTESDMIAIAAYIASRRP